MKLITSAIAIFLLVITTAASAQTTAKTDYELVYEQSYSQLKSSLLEYPSGFNAMEHKFDGKLNSAEDLNEALAELASLVDGKLLDRTETQAWKARVASGYIGIGLSIEELHQIGDDGLLLKEVIADSTAEAAGLKTGDRIVAVDGVSLFGKTPRAAGELIQGPELTLVVLKVSRNNMLIDVDVIRDIDEKIGIEMELDKPRTVFKARFVREDGPAGTAGLKEGDIIYGIEGHPSYTISIERAYELLKKPFIGDTVTLSVSSEGSPASDLVIKTGIVRSWDDSLSFRGQSGGGDLFYNNFTMGLTNLDFEKIAYYSKVFVEDYDYPGGIIDLRGATGSDVLKAVEIVANHAGVDGELLRVKERVDGQQVVTVYTLKKGVIERTRGQETVKVLPDFKPSTYSGKLVGVVDGETSGTGEAVAKALQRLGRLTIVGSSTAGKPNLTGHYLIDDTRAVSYKSAVLLEPDGSVMTHVVADRGVLLSGGDAIHEAKLELAGRSFYSHNKPVIIALSILFVIFFSVFLVMQVLRHKNRKEMLRIDEQISARYGPAPETQPVEVAKPSEPERPMPRWQRLLLAIPLVAMLALAIGLGLMVRNHNGVPDGAYSKVTVELYTDGSEETLSQKAVFDKLASEYTGDIEFQTIDIRSDPKAEEKYGFGKLDSFPRIIVSTRLYNKAGEQVSVTRSGRGGKVPKRELVPMIERASDVYDNWPKVSITRNKTP